MNFLNMDIFCYICYEEESKDNKFLKPNICKCKNIRIHKKCFTRVQKNTQCSICKNNYDSIYAKIDKKVIKIFSFGYYEKYTVNKKNKIIGLYTSYYPNNTIFVHTLYKNGKKHGYSQVFYPNGN
jgi:E3 ubiquitin-protein ligase DOA10